MDSQLERLSTTALSTKPAKGFSAPTVAASLRATVWPNIGTRQIRRPETSRNGTANYSSTPPADPPAKNRIPCPWGTHPVSLGDTYGRHPGERPYVPLRDT